MRAEQMLREGKLLEAKAELQEQIRGTPGDARYRVFLFQLLSVLGEWERAQAQLKVSGQLDVATLAMVHVYTDALQCETLRDEIFTGRRAPLIFGEPEPWVALLVEALRLTAQGQHGPARQLRLNAFDAAPTSPGTIDGQPFEWIADADERLGPVLETIMEGRYYWVPFQRIREIRIEAPADLRDVVWTPARFTWTNGGETVGLIPTRYPGSQNSDDDAIRMARKTEWLELAEGVHAGRGQRMLATDIDEAPLMAIRHIVLSDSGPPGSRAAAGAIREMPIVELPDA